MKTKIATPNMKMEDMDPSECRSKPMAQIQARTRWLANAGFLLGHSMLHMICTHPDYLYVETY